MKYSENFKKTALDSLFGNWGVAVRTGFVASLIGGNLTSMAGVDFDSDSISDLAELFKNSEQLRWLYPIFMAILTMFLLWVIFVIVISGAGKLGYAVFNLNLVDKKKASFSDLFSQFNRLGKGFGMIFIIGLYTFLWSLLFVIPGIIKSYSYSMTPYILAEHTDYSEKQAITKSKEIMEGNKWQLFCLDFSFIGWSVLCALPPLACIPLVYVSEYGALVLLLVMLVSLFVGDLFLRPYREAARAAFYRYVSKDAFPPEESEYQQDSYYQYNN